MLCRGAIPMPTIPSSYLPASLRSPWVLGALTFVAWVLVLLVAKAILLRAMRRVAESRRWGWDAVVAQALSTPLHLAILASGLMILERSLELSPRWDRALDVTLTASIVLGLVLFVDRATRGLLDRLAGESMVLQGARGLIQGTVRGVTIAVGLLIFLDSIGISITPLLASLGVGSLAVALALQDTLANLFAGIYMVIDKPIEAGHYIRLESGEEGYVTRVGWRSTWVRMLSDSVVVVPNSKLSGSVITNFNLPQQELWVYVDLRVHYRSEFETVERITLEVAREVMRQVEGGVPGAEPTLRFHTFGESGLRLTVGLRVRDFVASYRARHEFAKRLVARYRREGIVIPYPTRTLDLPPGAPLGPDDIAGFRRPEAG